MTKLPLATLSLILLFIIQTGCKIKEKHPVILGNVTLNKEVDFKDPAFFEHFTETFYIDFEDQRAQGSISKICEAVQVDPRFQDKDSSLHGRRLSGSCFSNFSRAYMFSGFGYIDNYQYYDTTFMPVTIRRLLGGIFHPFQTDNILTGAQLDLCTYTPTYCQCPEMMVNTHFSTEVKNRFEKLMFEKHGKPDEINFLNPDLSKKLTNQGLPVVLVDTSYGVQTACKLMYIWKKNGYEIVMVISRDGPIFSDKISNPAFKKYQDKTEGRNIDSYMMNLLKEKSSEGTFRIDLMNNSIISYDSYYGFIKYKLDDDTESEIKNDIESKKQKEEQKRKKNTEVY
jgi:hypothetical protein